MRAKWWILGLLWPSMAQAAGFAVSEQGAAALGLANAVTGVEDAAGAHFFNPAAFTSSGLGVGASVSAVLPFLTHSDAQTTSSKFGVATPPAAHVVFLSGERGLRYGASLGLNVPFGATLAWPDEWSGRFEVQRISLEVFEASANAQFGYAGDGWSVQAAAGPRVLRSTVALERAVDAISSEGHVTLGGAANAVSFQVAVFGKIRDLSAGLSVRPGARLDFQGVADFSRVPIELARAAHDQPVTTFVELPTRAAFGAAYRVGPGTLSADVEMFGWSSFESFGIDFSDPNTPDVDEPRHWRDTWAIRAGWEHQDFELPLRMRFGVAWDPTPSPSETLSPTLPDADRISAHLGASFEVAQGWTADLAWSHVMILEHRATGEEAFPGTYSGFAEVLTVGGRAAF